MTQFFTLLDFIAQIPAIERDVAASGHLAIERMAQVVQRRAKGSLGKSHSDWPALAPSTLKDKAAGGFPVPSPLLRTGELRDSIEYTVQGLEAQIGTDMEIGVFHELGTSRMPARSFLASSLTASVPKLENIAVGVTVAALSGGGHGARDLDELWHMLREVGHEYAELGRDLMGDDEEERE